jgi:hypothetical protein
MIATGVMITATAAAPTPMRRWRSSESA